MKQHESTVGGEPESATLRIRNTPHGDRRPVAIEGHGSEFSRFNADQSDGRTRPKLAGLIFVERLNVVHRKPITPSVRGDYTIPLNSIQPTLGTKPHSSIPGGA